MIIENNLKTLETYRDIEDYDEKEGGRFTMPYIYSTKQNII
jgi:hypothetical protein